MVGRACLVVPCPCREACEGGGGDGDGDREETPEVPCPSQGEGGPCGGAYHVLGLRKKRMSVLTQTISALCPAFRWLGVTQSYIHNNSALYLEEVHAQIQAVGAQAGVPGDLETP